MNRLNEVLEMFERFFADQYEPFAFSSDLPDCLCAYYDEMFAAAPMLTEVLNEELPEICADYEPGFDVEAFKKKVRAEYDRALAAR